MFYVLLKYGIWTWPIPVALRFKSVVSRLLGSRIRFPLGAWMFVFCVGCVFCGLWTLRQADHSLRGVLLCVFVSVCDLETSTMRRPRFE